ncbi:TPA: hypothetical protein ACSJWK_001089 [Listeria monocytogenes]
MSPIVFSQEQQVDEEKGNQVNQTQVDSMKRVVEMDENDDKYVEESAIEDDSTISITTNAGEMYSGSNFSLEMNLTNNSGTVPKGTQYIISISPDAIDYSTIRFENPIDDFFLWKLIQPQVKLF